MKKALNLNYYDIYRVFILNLFTNKTVLVDLKTYEFIFNYFNMLIYYKMY